MSNQIILITGCQRSGTTLLHLILDSHPEVHGIDEMQFNMQRMVEYINSPGLAPCVSFKLPVASHALRFIESLPDRKILWCVRDLLTTEDLNIIHTACGQTARDYGYVF